jgi:hypothetical protein
MKHFNMLTITNMTMENFEDTCEKFNVFRVSHYQQKLRIEIDH